MGEGTKADWEAVVSRRAFQQVQIVRCGLDGRGNSPL